MAARMRRRRWGWLALVCACHAARAAVVDCDPDDPLRLLDSYYTQAPECQGYDPCIEDPSIGGWSAVQDEAQIVAERLYPAILDRLRKAPYYVGNKWWRCGCTKPIFTLEVACYEVSPNGFLTGKLMPRVRCIWAGQGALAVGCHQLVTSWSPVVQVGTPVAGVPPPGPDVHATVLVYCSDCISGPETFNGARAEVLVFGLPADKKSGKVQVNHGSWPASFNTSA